MQRLGTLPKSAVIFLGAVLLVCGCGDFSGVLGPGDRDDSAGASTDGGAPDLPQEPPEDPSPDPGDVEEPGPHLGERLQLEVEIVFSQEFGETVTDACGTHYHFGDFVIDEDKVYPEEYWGTYPLYFFGTEVGVTVTVTNPGPRAREKLRIRTEAYVLLTDGSNGAQLAAPREIDVEVERGETVTIDASFTAEYDPNAVGMEGGLDRFIVTVLHPNAGNDDSAVIMTKEGIFCPPEIEAEF